jgi:hypothetical protein
MRKTHARVRAKQKSVILTQLKQRRKCPKVSNMISYEPIWQGIKNEKTLDLKGFYGLV